MGFGLGEARLVFSEVNVLGIVWAFTRGIPGLKSETWGTLRVSKSERVGTLRSPRFPAVFIGLDKFV
jgi:hypothetical protein